MWLANVLHNIGLFFIQAGDFLQARYGNGTAFSTAYYSQALSLSLIVLVLLGINAIYKRWQEDHHRYLHWMDAMARMDALIVRDPQNAVAYWVKGELFEMHLQYRESLRCYRKAHHLCPAAYSYSEMRDAARRLQSYIDGRATPHGDRAPLHSYSY